jgi:cupin fold WbuC family metalloprotein
VSPNSSPPSSVQLIDLALFEKTVARAQASPRLRANHNFHSSAADNPHRFLNAFLRGSYAAPHRHLVPPKAESFIVLRGSLVCFLFNDAGRVTDRYVLGTGDLAGIDVPPGAWHTVAAVSDVAIAYEVKPGPWDPATDKEFAPWAPPEDATEAGTYLSELLRDL